MLKKMKINGKLLTLFVTALILFGTIVNIIIYNQFSAFVTKSTLETNSNLCIELINAEYEGDWSVKSGKLYKGSSLINDDTELVDGIKSAADVECTLFLNDTRVATTVESNGKRATGTQADATVVKDVITNGKTYSGSAEILGTDYKTRYIPLKDKSGSVIGMFFIGIKNTAIEEQVMPIIMEIIFITFVLVVISVIIISIFSKMIIIKPIKGVIENMGKLGEGDLTFEISHNVMQKRDEFGEMARALEKTQNSFRAMIDSIRKQSANIDSQSASLSAVSEEMTAASESVTISIQDIASGTGSQASDMDEIARTTNVFGSHIEKIVNAIEEINTSAIDIGDMANTSATNMDNLSVSINEIETAFKNNTETLEMLEVKIGKISDISSAINQIADQTNLLALNASIEAARAGEAGRGFAVVADEIRKLAEESRVSSENITTLISDIIVNSENMTKSSGEMGDKLTKEIDIVASAVSSFDGIVNAINVMVPKMQEIDASSISIQNDKNTIVGRIEAAAAVSQQVCASTEEITSSTEEMYASIEEVATTAQNLSNLTREMLDNVEKFKL